MKLAPQNLVSWFHVAWKHGDSYDLLFFSQSLDARLTAFIIREWSTVTEIIKFTNFATFKSNEMLDW